MKFFYSKMILHENNFVKIIIIRPQKSKLIPKIKCTIFLNNYIISIIILNSKVAQRGGHRSVFSPKNNASASVKV